MSTVVSGIANILIGPVLIFCHVLVVATIAISPAAFAADGQTEQLAASSSHNSSLVLDRVVASLDGEPITMSDLDKHIRSLGEANPDEKKNSSTAEKAKLARYLRDLLVLQMLRKEATEAGIVVGDEEIDAYLVEIKTQNNVDDPGFRQLLAAKGLSYDDYLEQVRGDIIRARILNMRVRAKINVVDEDIERFLKARPELMPKEGEVRIQQVLVPTDGLNGKGQAEATEEIDKIRATIVGGVPIDQAGGEYHRDLGFVKIEELKKDLRKVAEGLAPGELSEVIITERGPSLIIVSVSESGGSDLVSAEAKKEIHRKIFQERYQEETKRFLNDELPKKYHVEFKL